MFGVWDLGFRVNDIWEGPRGDRGGGPKNGQNSLRSKPGHL